MSWHASLPWPFVRQLYRDFRRAFFTKPRPEGVYLRIHDATARGLERDLGSKYFAPNWEFSYNKRGEDINLARIESAPHPIRTGTDVEWMQDHIRGWAQDGFVDLGCHYEPEPTEHAKEHLEGGPFSRSDGMDHLRAVLDELDIEYEEVEWSDESS